MRMLVVIVRYSGAVLGARLHPFATLSDGHVINRRVGVIKQVNNVGRHLYFIP